MDLSRILLSSILACGLVVCNSYVDLADQKHEYRNWKASPRGKSCSFCDFYEKSQLSPYELLWKVGSEIWRGLTQKQLSLLLMNPEQLRNAEYIFNVYCDRICGNPRNPAMYHCQND